MRVLILIFFLSIGLLGNAQDVIFNNITYKVKKDKIFNGDLDVTDTLPVDEKKQIIASFDEKKQQIKEA
jgi:hypothetical protein